MDFRQVFYLYKYTVLVLILKLCVFYRFSDAEYLYLNSKSELRVKNIQDGSVKPITRVWHLLHNHLQ